MYILIVLYLFVFRGVFCKGEIILAFYHLFLFSCYMAYRAGFQLCSLDPSLGSH